jgi:sugar-specific transcriptional regulator TrmB
MKKYDATPPSTILSNKLDTVDELLVELEKKVALLLEWKENAEAAQELSDGGCLEAFKSEGFDDRCIEIEEHFENEYGICFDSYGTGETIRITCT